MEKPKLNMSTETVNFIDWNDFESFVKEIYNIKNYDFAAIQECDNDSSHRFKPDGIITHSWNKTSTDEIRKGKIKCYQNSLLFNCLVADGYLEPGVYIVEVCW